MPARKRAAAEPVVDASPRRSRRISSTPKKSLYFDGGSDDDSDAPPKKRGRPAKRQSLKKEESEEAYEEDDDNNNHENAEDDEDDDDDDDDMDEAAPPKVQIIPLEKLRDLGGVDYEDGKIHKNTVLFLKDLKANNRRPWLKSHDGEYRRALKDWQSFVEHTSQTVMEIDETVPELPVKDVSFRIHRDIRFSKDPTPYKPHFSAAWSRTGRKGPYACYYIHCEPGSSFIGGGLWCPDAQHIQRLRASIDERPSRWRRALNEPVFRKTFFPGVKATADSEAALKAFASKNQNNALKTKPKGWLADHRDIELLKLRNFTVGKKIDESMLCADSSQEEIADIVRALSGFVSFLNSIVMPDPGDEDDSGSDDSADGVDDEERLGV